MPNEINEIKELSVMEVSLVKKGAVGRDFLIFKSEEEIDEQHENKIEKGGIKMTDKNTTKVEDVKKEDETKKVENVKKEEKPTEGITKENVKNVDVPEEVKTQLEQLFKANEELSKKLQKELDDKKEKQYIAKAETLTNLPMQPAEFGLVLKRIADVVEAADFEALETVLKAANNEISQSHLFKEMGSGASGYAGKNAYSKIEKIAKALQEAEPTLTEAQSIEKAMEQNPALYSQYLTEANQ